METHSGISAVW